MRLLRRLALFAVALAVPAIPAQRGAQPAAPQSAAAPQRKIPCKTPENASMCYWTRGRLNFYTGNPSYRIWKVGTKRILGIYSGPNSQQIDPMDGGHPELPINLESAYHAETVRNAALHRVTPYLIGYVFADFEVCPLEPEHEGWMQAVCIESATNIFVDASKQSYR